MKLYREGGAAAFFAAAKKRSASKLTAQVSQSSRPSSSVGSSDDAQLVERVAASAGMLNGAAIEFELVLRRHRVNKLARVLHRLEVYAPVLGARTPLQTSTFSALMGGQQHFGEAVIQAGRVCYIAGASPRCEHR